MKKSKIVYVDLDDTIADFSKATKDPLSGQIEDYKMFDRNFFFNLKPIPGAQGAIYELEKMGFDVYILSQPLAESPESYSDKARWVLKYFPSLYKKLILTQNKGLNIGHYLIDDNLPKWKEKFEQTGGLFVHFPYGGYNKNSIENTEQCWRNLVSFFKDEIPYVE